MSPIELPDGPRLLAGLYALGVYVVVALVVVEILERRARR